MTAISPIFGAYNDYRFFPAPDIKSKYLLTYFSKVVSRHVQVFRRSSMCHSMDFLDLPGFLFPFPMLVVEFLSSILQCVRDPATKILLHGLGVLIVKTVVEIRCHAALSTAAILIRTFNINL